MEDARIVEMYFERNETAIEETQKKYGRYCHYIAYNILYSDPDAEECVNDTYLRAWEAMPPHRPSKLATFLGKITRNLALNRYAYEHAKKRGDGVDVALDELAEVLADPESETGEDEILGLRELLNAFMETLTEDARVIFVRRYWYMCRVAQIAKDLGLTESRVKVTLHRTREKLKAYLEKEGVTL
ncbi:MAG: sigma-70 family RNA polymerase sigma factor [Clostridia bacterium]|nr:sigma-70 family RNA polymerase sigma factor [Clostridia bacterium]